MNVLIYSGEGTSVESVRQTKECITRLLSSRYAVSMITAQQIVDEPWIGYTALLVMPGGADIPYCRALNGIGNQKIKQYVRHGGKYLGICAGAYYGASAIEFESGTDLEVSGPRELGFYRGTARGTVFKGFQYGTNLGASAAAVVDASGGFTKVFYNGGCMFEGDQDADVLARYEAPVEIYSAEESPPAIVHKRYGEGDVVLSGVHVEYSVDSNIQVPSDFPETVVKQLEDFAESRVGLMKLILSEALRLEINQDSEAPIPHLTALQLTSLENSTPSVNQFLDYVSPIVKNDHFIEDAHDKFNIVDMNNFVASFKSDFVTIIVYEPGTVPNPQQTPYFNHNVYYSELEGAIKDNNLVGRPTVGSLLLYGEVVSSTSTLLDANPMFLKHAPHGLVIHATQQIAGRGRGSNVWVNPIGVLAISGVLRVPRTQCTHPLVFVQYLIALALVKTVNSMLPPGVDIGLRLKWPNDVYIQKEDKTAVKIGGIMVSCNVYNGDFVLVYGSGTNINNMKPTTSINSRIAELNAGPPILLEALMARYLSRIDRMFQEFLVNGFFPFEKDYYEAWLHTDAQVTLERYGGVHAVLRGISPYSGMLLAEDTSGVRYELQPDGNSFDMLRGLIRKKI